MVRPLTVEPGDYYYSSIIICDPLTRTSSGLVAFVNPHSTVEGAYHAVRCVERIPIFQAEPGQIFLPVIQLLLTPTSSLLTSRHHTTVVHTVLAVTGGALANIKT